MNGTVIAALVAVLILGVIALNIQAELVGMANLFPSNDRFYRTWILHRGADGALRNIEQFTYDSHKVIYDVLLFEGTKLVRTNYGPLSNIISDWKPAHYAIEAHFNLNKP